MLAGLSKAIQRNQLIFRDLELDEKKNNTLAELVGGLRLNFMTIINAVQVETKRSILH